MLYSHNILIQNILPPPANISAFSGMRVNGKFSCHFLFIIATFFFQHFVNATTCAGSAFAFREPSRNNMLHQRSINNNKMPNFYIETLNFFEYEYSLVL